MLAIFKAPMGWFDETPIGNILSRTTKDQDNLDTNLPMTMQFCLINILKIIGTIIIASIAMPLFLIPISISFFIYCHLIKKYLHHFRFFILSFMYLWHYLHFLNNIHLNIH